MSTEEKIKAHRAAMLAGTIECESKDCPVCGDIPDRFKLHERRKRQFRVIIGVWVRILLTFLPRWKCPLCDHTFTEYPSFALPHKLYVKEAVLKLSGAYLEEPGSKYRQGVKAGGSAIGCEGAGPDGSGDDRQLAHSTLWGWIAFFGSLVKTLRGARRLIKEKAPATGLFRQAAQPAEYRYRSESRRRILQRALELVWAEIEYVRVFGLSIFPGFGTGACWM